MTANRLELLFYAGRCTRIILGNPLFLRPYEVWINKGSIVDYVKNHILKIMETWDKPTPAVLIFHDVFPVTYQHLDKIITYLKNEGYVLAHFK